MINEHDRVILKIDLPAKGLVKGDVGTVVMVHGNHHGYEVEFFALDGKTLSVETLKSDQIRPVKSNEVTHSREVV